MNSASEPRAREAADLPHADCPAGMFRIAGASFAGGAIEIYDVLVYGLAAALVLGPLYFPSFSPVAGVVAAFATYAVGFFARPLGSLLFGHLGDRHGRRPMLIATLALTGVSTMLVGCVPTYSRIGIAAPLLLVVLRFCQGLGQGGEWGGAALMATEHAPPHRRGLWGSFPVAGPLVGTLFANGIMLALSGTLDAAQFQTWGWRVPFWAAGVLVVVGLRLRIGAAETPAFRELDARRQISRVPAVDLLHAHRGTLLLVVGALTAGFAFYYTVTVWALGYATGQLGIDKNAMLVASLVSLGPQLVWTPVAGMLGDRFGRRTMCVVGTAGMLVWAVPFILLLRDGRLWVITLDVTVAMLVFITAFGVLPAYLPELFESRFRCTGTSLAYCLGGVTGGALTPVIATALSTGSGVPWAVAGYIAALAVLSLVCFAWLPQARFLRGTAAARPRGDA